MIRQKIYDIVELKEVNSLASRLYNQFMLILVVISMLPLAFKEDYEIFAITDVVVVSVFILDYLLNWLTADIRFGQRGIWPFIRYPFSLPVIVDMLSILPALAFIHDGFRLLRITRGLRILRMLSVFKLVHHSQNMVLVVRTLKESRDSLLAVGYLAVGYILAHHLQRRAPDLPHLFRCPLLGYRLPHHRGLWRYLPRLHHRPLCHHVLLPPRHSPHRPPRRYRHRRLPQRPPIPPEPGQGEVGTYSNRGSDASNNFIIMDARERSSASQSTLSVKLLVFE